MNLTVDMREVNANLAKMPPKIVKASVEAMRDTVVAISNDAIKHSPHITGNNKRSIKYIAKKLYGEIFSTSGYGGYLETGTRRMAAQPYFKPALDKEFPKFTERMKEILRW